MANYCKDCVHCKHEEYCLKSFHTRTNFVTGKQTTIYDRCINRNTHGLCPDYEKKKHWWRS